MSRWRAALRGATVAIALGLGAAGAVLLMLHTHVVGQIIAGVLLAVFGSG